MKVKELIKELEKYDWDMNVYVWDWEDYTVDDCLELKQEIESFSFYKDGSLLWSRVDPTLEEAEKKTEKRDKVERRNVLVIYADY